MSVRPKKSLGQHFLADPEAVRRIVAAVQAPSGAPVVEIGPGEGALTGALMARYPHLVALEVDREAIAHLRRRFPALDVREQDVLTADWSRLDTEAGGSSPKSAAPNSRLHVVGNLPYYITSPIVFALLDARAHLARAVVMVQKEVAERMVAPHGSKTYGTLSVYLGLYARAQLLFDVGPEAFRPPPKVESAVVAIEFSGVAEPEVAFSALQRVVRAAFGQRRKMLRNSLKPLVSETRREIPEWAATLRPEQVAPRDFVRLAHHFLSPAT
ncbi:MAG: 16S rRNA (adenine(1518)-N(6)/adenine(1519)-N(6))-dimethyltransferase RsmA [Bacteroidota bacterium]